MTNHSLRLYHLLQGDFTSKFYMHPQALILCIIETLDICSKQASYDQNESYKKMEILGAI